MVNETHEPQPVWWVELRWTGERTMCVEKIYNDPGIVWEGGYSHLKITDPLVQDEIGAFNHARRTLERLGIALG